MKHKKCATMKCGLRKRFFDGRTIGVFKKKRWVNALHDVRCSASRLDPKNSTRMKINVYI